MKSKAVLLCTVVASVFLLLACYGGVNGVPEPRPSSENDIETGRRLIASYGCGSCHSIPGIPGANSMVAPPLDCFSERLYIAGRLPNTWENLSEWIQHPQQIDPSTSMPDVGANIDQARNMATYLYQQSSRGRLGNWLGGKCS